MIESFLALLYGAETETAGKKEQADEKDISNTFIKWNYMQEHKSHKENTGFASQLPGVFQALNTFRSNHLA